MENKVLLVVDIQNDFLPGGSLAVSNGNKILPAVNRLIDKFDIIVATQDWHPADHISFASNHKSGNEYDVVDLNGISQVLWPDHCIQGSKGAAFHKDLKTDKFAAVIRKGFRKDLDSYSAFFENDKSTPTGLSGFLQTLKITDVFICGIALDYCVYFSAVDSLKCGFSTSIIVDASMGIDFPEDNIENTMNDFKSKGGYLVRSGDLL